MFVKPPTNDGELYMGALTVIVDNEPFSYMGMQVLTCQDVGSSSPVRPNRKVKGKMKVMMLPVSVLLPVPKGKIGVKGPQAGMTVKKDPPKKDEKKEEKKEHQKLTKKEATEQAEKLGYSPVKDPPFNAHNQPVFKDSKGNFISPDVDGHNGGVWKMFDRSGNRTGTYNSDLTTKIGK
jgi:hypothetical protein